MKRRLFKRRPTLRQLPVEFLKVAVAAVALAAPLSIVMGWLGNYPLDKIFGHPLLWLWDSCGMCVIFGVTFYATCALPNVYLGPIFRRLSGAIGRTLQVLTALAGGISGCLIALTAIRFLFHIQVSTPLSLGKMAIVDGIVALVISLTMGAFLSLRAEKELRERTLSEAAAKAQTFALQAQINPHFFFNTLNTISALIPIDPGAAQAAIGQLADMFRYTLSCSRAELVSLEDELTFARNYLELERLRFGNRLRVELPEKAAGVVLPGLTLQPLVENAVRYGVAQRLDGGTVRVQIERRNGHCDISVANQFDPSLGAPNLDVNRIFRNGHALANIRERLRLVFGDRADLRISVVEKEWVDVTVHIPAS